MGSKSLVQIRSDLRTDLSDTGALWSDAEVDRSVERAIADLSRMLPLEKVFEKTLAFTVTNEAYTSPIDVDADYIVDNQSLNTMVAGDTFTLAGNQPDYPRVLKFLITDETDTITNFAIIVKGTDTDDKAVSETFYFQNGLSQTSNVEFKTVEEVELDVIAGTAQPQDVLDIGIGDFEDVWATLANKPIKYTSESHSNSLVLTTDFLMDYTNGRIKPVSGGSLTANTAYTISYTIGQVWIDLSDLVDLIRVESVIYPVGNIPQNRVVWDVWGRVLTVTGSDEHGEQEAMSEARHAAVYYNAAHQPPTIYGPGSYPSFLENTVLLAAGAYALFIHALKFEQQAVTDFASSRIALGNTSAIHTLVATALAKVATYMASINTALDGAKGQTALSSQALAKINDDSGRVYLTDADTALDASVTALADSNAALAKVDTYLVGGTESTKALLAQIATDIASLRTAAVTAADAANTTLDGIDYSDVGTHLGTAVAALAKVITYLENNTNEDSKFWLTKITTDIAELRTKIQTAVDALNTAADAASSDLANADAARDNYINTTNYVDGGTAPDIKKYLNDGDNILNTIAVGGENERTPEMYLQYARGTRDALVSAHEQDRAFYNETAGRYTNNAAVFAQEAAQRLSNLRSYIEQADGWGRIAAGFVSEASGRIQAAVSALAREQAKVVQANSYLAESAERMNSLRTYIEQAAAYTSISTGFVLEARERTSLAATYISEAAQRVAIADRYLAESANRVATANAYTAEANGRLGTVHAFIAEANSRLGEIDRHLADSDRYIALADRNIALAEKFREDATIRRDEAWTIWRDRKQYIGDFSSSSTRQMPR